MSSIAFLLIKKAYPGWDTAENMQRAEKLVTQARAIAPDAEGAAQSYPINCTASSKQNHRKQLVVAEELIRRFPTIPSGYVALSTSKVDARTRGGSHSIAGKSDPAQPA